MSKIKKIVARQICDSRGNPTVETRVYLDSGRTGWAAVPSGSSKGKREALELRDVDSSIYRGKGVAEAVRNINTTIDLALRRYEIRSYTDQRVIDSYMLELDGTRFKEKLGANAILAVSLAIADAAAQELCGEERLFEYVAWLRGRDPHSTGYMLPVPMVNVINGGAHADSGIRIQEFMVIPVGAESLWEALKITSRVFRAVGTLVEGLPDNLAVGVGDEGGYSAMLCPGQPQETKVRAALDLLLKSIETAGLRPGADIVLAIDAAASEFFNPATFLYDFRYVNDPVGASLTSEQMIDFYEDLIDKYPICSIEDGLGEDDEVGWVALTERLGHRIQLVGDDLFVTNTEVFQAGIEKGMANSILIKVNQIGTLTEALDAIGLAEKHGYTCVVSHRSGETVDTKIADIAVGCSTGQIKTGSMSRGDRIAKYNRLKDIEIALGSASYFPGGRVFPRLRQQREIIGRSSL